MNNDLSVLLARIRGMILGQNASKFALGAIVSGAVVFCAQTVVLSILVSWQTIDGHAWMLGMVILGALLLTQLVLGLVAFGVAVFVSNTRAGN